MKPTRRRLTTSLHTGLVVLVTAGLCANPAFGWGPEGHRIVAMIAASHLSPSAFRGVTALLKTDGVAKVKLGTTPTPATMAAAMASIASWADDIKRTTNTGSWHFLDLASADQQADLAARCAGGNCVTEKIRAMTGNLQAHKGFPHGTQTFTTTEELKFIIHLMGDLHQPLHAATNADAGGNCLTTQGFGTSELHAAWDGGMIGRVLLKGTNEIDLAHALDAKFATRFQALTALTEVNDMALESHTVAFQKAYGPLLALLPAPEPRPFRVVSVSACATQVPEFFNISPHPNLVQLYNDVTFDTVRQQLATGGYRLAALLNAVFGAT
jgi:nuclease S1